MTATIPAAVPDLGGSRAQKERTARDVHHTYAPAGLVPSREPLVLLNSLATTTEIWDPLLPRLTESTDVVRLDYPGHGGSPARSVPRDLDELATLVIDVVDDFGLDRIHVAGVSIGGMTALRLAQLFPERIASVTVIGSAPMMDAQLWQRRKRVVEQWGTRGLKTSVLDRWFTPQFAASHPDVVSRYTQMLEGTVDSAYAVYCDLLAASDLRPDLGEISCSAVVISGTEDSAATVEDGRCIASGVPGARHIVLDGVAHMLQAMEPERIARIIADNVRASA